MKSIKKFFVAFLRKTAKNPKCFQTLFYRFIGNHGRSLQKLFAGVYQKEDFSSSQRVTIIFSFLFSLLELSDKELEEKRFSLNHFLVSNEYNKNKEMGELFNEALNNDFMEHEELKKKINKRLPNLN
jgi:hypothetical protein